MIKQFYFKQFISALVIGPYQVLSFLACAELRMMAIKVYSAFPKLQHYWNLTIRSFNVMGGDLTILQRYSQCILYPQPTGLVCVCMSKILNMCQHFLLINLYIYFLGNIRRQIWRFLQAGHERINTAFIWNWLFWCCWSIIDLSYKGEFFRFSVNCKYGYIVSNRLIMKTIRVLYEFFWWFRKGLHGIKPFRRAKYSLVFFF